MVRGLVAIGVCVVLLGGGCAGGPAQARQPKKGPAKVVAKASVLPAASASPGAPGGDLAARVRADFARRARLFGPDGAPLVGPDGATLVGPDGATVLVGRVRLDARYAVRVGAGRAAGDVIAMGGADLDDGAGGNVVVQGSAELISDNGLGLISDNGLGLISDNGLGIIANNGGGLISDNGLGILANNGGGLAGPAAALRLLAAPAAGDDAGGLLAAGMRVLLLDLRDGRPVPLGRDEAGEPVYAIYTDARGRYAVAPPPALRHNVVVVAQPPDRRDARLTLGRVTAPGVSGELAIDEAGALATAYFRTMMVAQITELVGRDTGGSLFPARFSAQIPEAIRQRAETVAQELRLAYRAAGLPGKPEAERRRVVQAAADAMCAHVDLTAVEIDTAATSYKGPGGLAMPALADFFGQAARGAAARLREDPAFFAARPYLAEANAARAAQGLPPTAIERPSDVGAFLLREYFSRVDQDEQERAKPLLDDVGVPEEARLRLRGTIYGLYLAVGTIFVFDDAVKAEVLRAVAEQGGLRAEPVGP